jgi:PAS domain-containing protein
MDETIANVVPAELIRTAFERCPSGLIVVDRAGTITVVNGEVERLFGYTRAELITDNNMPHLTGLELVEKVLARRRDLPVIMLSASAPRCRPRSSRRAAFAWYCPSPIRSTICGRWSATSWRRQLERLAETPRAPALGPAPK